MTALFLSDLHLDESRPEATHCLLQFLRCEALSARRLYLLGDLFEAWVGDDDTNAHHRQVLQALREYADTGRRVYFMAGNRDFLLGPDALRAAGMTRLHDPSIVYVAGTSVLLTHGDMLCTDDIAYQRYRRVVHNPWVQRAYRALPFSIRQGIVSGTRRRSKDASRSKPATIMDVNPTAVASSLRDAGVSVMVHGHTHRQGMHRFELHGKPACRIVLGDWYQAGSALVWDSDEPEFLTLPFEPA